MHFDVNDTVERAEESVQFGPTSSLYTFGVFAVGQIREAEGIAQRIRQSGRVRLVEPLFTYPTKWFLSPREALLDDMLAKAGITPLGM